MCVGWVVQLGQDPGHVQRGISQSVPRQRDNSLLSRGGLNRLHHDDVIHTDHQSSEAGHIHGNALDRGEGLARRRREVGHQQL